MINSTNYSIFIRAHCFAASTDSTVPSLIRLFSKLDFSIYSTWPDDLPNEGKPIDAALRIRIGPADQVIAAWISKYRQQPRRVSPDKCRNDRPHRVFPSDATFHLRVDGPPPVAYLLRPDPRSDLPHHRIPCVPYRSGARFDPTT